MKFATFCLVAGLIPAVPAVADNVPPSPAAWAAQMGDFSANSLPARSPEHFVGFLNAGTEPEFHQQRLNNLSEPAYWGRATDTLASPGFVGNMAAVATPQTAFAWAQAMMDPRFYEAMASVLGDPAKWARWSQASLSPASYQPFAKPFDPALQARWQSQMQSPANWQAMFNPIVASPLARPAAQ
ncbi:MAG: hypothetical protein LDL19_08065 [Thiobacillus sp.]|nr:hypothetical protein [Thiobacillus sp.]